MRILAESGYWPVRINPGSGTKAEPPVVVSGKSAGFIHQDELDLRSMKARELPAGEIQEHTVRRFFSPEINASLDEALAGRPPEVSEAVYRLIERNLFASNADWSEEERDILFEAGLSQAALLAERFVDPGKASSFLDAIHVIAAIAQTRNVDPATGQASYIELPQKPLGAPDDYINTGELMKQYDPESFAKLQAAHESGGNWGGILIQFAAKLRHNPKWVEDYLEERNAVMSELRNASFENRFAHASTSSLAEYRDSIHDLAGQIHLADKQFLTENIEDFVRLLEGV